MRKFVSFLACFGLSLSLALAGPAESVDEGAPSEEAQAAPDAAEATPKAAKQRRMKRERRPAAKALTSVPADEDPTTMHFWGTCGASAAIALDRGRVVIGSDDDNFLRTYSLVEPDELVVRNEAGEVDSSQSLLHKPRATQNLYKFLQVNQFSQRNFSAIEGATLGEGMSYWIGSHARREDGETRPNRRRLFAMSVKPYKGSQTLAPYGQPVLDLAHRMSTDEKIKRSGFRNAIMPQYRKLEHLSPVLRGIDIQGLAMAPDGQTLWIALRNPYRGSKAFIVPLENPAAVVTGDVPVFGAPFELVLGGRGISALEWVPARGEYLIVSGKVGEASGYQLHRWSGDPTSPPTKGRALPADLDVQSFVVSEDGTRMLLFSDDSGVLVRVESADVCRAKRQDGACPCGRIEGQGPKRFRARWVPIEGEAEAEAGP